MGTLDGVAVGVGARGGTGAGSKNVPGVRSRLNHILVGVVVGVIVAIGGAAVSPLNVGNGVSEGVTVRVEVVGSGAVGGNGAGSPAGYIC